MTDKENKKNDEFAANASPLKKSILEPEKPKPDNLDEYGNIAYIPIME